MKNQKVKRTLALLLATVMTMSMAACGGEDKNAVNDTETASKPVQEESAKSLDDYEKVSEFNYFGIASGITDEEFNQLDMVKQVEEHTGYKVTYGQPPADPTDAQTAITNIFMLKQDYQGVQVTKDQFYTLLTMGALKPITEYVNGSTNLKEQISEFGWETAKKDGEIYAIPRKDALATTDTGLCYRVDWLNEYNEANPDKAIPVPAEENGYSMTVSDYKTMLEYFKTKVPDGGYAMTIDTAGVFVESILPAFGVYGEWADVDGTLTYIVDQPGFADYVAYMEDLYDSGLIQYQATANDTGAVKALQTRMSGAGRIAHWNAYAIETTNGEEGTDLSTFTDDTIGYISALVPDDCKGDASKVRIFAKEGYSYYTVIPAFASEEQAAAVVDWADKKLEKEFFETLVVGVEGETYTVEDDAYYPILPEFNDRQGYADKFMDGSREEDYAKYWLCRTRKTAAQDKMFSRTNFNIENTGIKSPITVMPTNEAYDTYYNAANLEVKNLLVVTMFNEETPCSIDDLKAKFNEFQGEQIIESVNEWYSGWELKDSFNDVLPR